MNPNDVYYKRNGNIKGGSPKGRKIMRWDFFIKSFIYYFWLYVITENSEDRGFVRSKNDPPVYSIRVWKQANILEILHDDPTLHPYYEKLYKTCDGNEKQMLNKLHNRIHKMYYQKKRGRAFRSSEHIEERKDKEEQKQIALGKKHFIENYSYLMRKELC